jgi:cell division protein FtsQ
MRDYKNVKVPRSYRSNLNRMSVKRIDAGRAVGRARTSGTGIRKIAMRIITIVLVVTGGLVAGQVYKTLLHAEMFQIAGVDVKGVKHVSEADLREFTGVFTGRNIFSADLAASVRRARANPWVKDVRIYRRLPNRISMVVTERVAYALLDTGAGKYVMDDEGFVIDRIPAENVATWQLPVVALKGYRIQSGGQATSEGMAEALTLIAEISGRGGWRLQDVTIKAASSESISILYADHEFKIGTGNYAEKLRRLTEIMSDVKERGLEIASVDLRPERQAAVMVSKGKIPNNKHQIPNKHQ